MEEQFGLEEKFIPFKKDITDKGYAQAPIYVSPDWKDNEKRALVLIQGTGEVRAGIWARSVWTSDSLDMGSMLPQIKFAVENKMSCLILNPNYLKDEDRDVDPRIDTMKKHWIYAYKKYVISRCRADEIFIIAHSAGGTCWVELFKKYSSDFLERVKGIAFTDSAHKDFSDVLVDADEEEWVKNNCIHFVKSSKELGTPEKSKSGGMIPTVSAGHPEHEYTTGSSWIEIQKFFKARTQGKMKIRDHTCFSNRSYKGEE